MWSGYETTAGVRCRRMVGPPGQLDPRSNYTKIYGWTGGPFILPDGWTPSRINGPPCVLFAHARACLTRHNQQALEGDHWLSNRHISAVNTLLRQQHPGQNGLQDTLELSKNLKWRSNSVDFVQIVSPCFPKPLGVCIKHPEPTRHR